MPPFDDHTPLTMILGHPQGRAVLMERVPGLLTSSMMDMLYRYPIAVVLATEPELEGQPAAIRSILDALAALEPADPIAAPLTPTLTTPVISVSPAPAVQRADGQPGTAPHAHAESVAQWDRFELTLQGPDDGNPFLDVDLSAEFAGPQATVVVPGFYDGDGVYRVRFMPPAMGAWRFRTRSTVSAMDGVEGDFTTVAARPGVHGPVRVAHQFHFAYADGTPYRPIGTTAYAWTHQQPALREQTLRTLASSPFNKMRMAVPPKSYLYNTTEPSRYPFLGSVRQGWDSTRFDVRFFQDFERQVELLGELGIEADIILFHAYDRWGFSQMDPATDDRYVRYLVARLGAHRNVWWSLANEFDLLPNKTIDDWERWAALIQEGDPSGHLMSIHNCLRFYDHSRPWITHVSAQRIDVCRTAEEVDTWRERWGKPVIVDECGYEGNLDLGWGNLTGQELVRRHWEGTVRGGYVGHGETYVNDREELWWSKGGVLEGDSPARIAFLRRILEEGPARGLEPDLVDWDVPRAGRAGEQYIYYFGANQPSSRRFVLDPSTRYRADIIDTWAMTVTELDGTYTGRFELTLPGRPFIAVRLRAV